MNHIIAYCQFIKIRYRPAVISLFPAGFLLFFLSENITFGNNNKLNNRILKTLVKITVSDHNLPIGQRFIKAFTEIRIYPVIP